MGSNSDNERDKDVGCAHVCSDLGDAEWAIKTIPSCFCLLFVEREVVSVMDRFVSGHYILCRTAGEHCAQALFVLLLLWHFTFQALILLLLLSPKKRTVEAAAIGPTLTRRRG